MGDISKYIESVLDGVVSIKDVVKDGDQYIITITKKNLFYKQVDMNFIELTNSIEIRRQLEIYFPNDEIKFQIKHIFV